MKSLIGSLIGLVLSVSVSAESYSSNAASSTIHASVSGGDTPKMYWTDVGTGTIERSNLDGSNRQTLVSGLSTPIALALDTLGAVVRPCLSPTPICERPLSVA